jgi:UDP-3-O-[3-hydroxymyristoyl] glucosamine N-acyltransferase
VIGAGSILGNRVVIGENTRLHARVTVYDGCEIGKRGLLHSGAVIGADGFGLALEAGSWLKIPQIGRVRIGDDVEIGANTTIDRGALDDTIIEDGVKLDNQIQIGHNAIVGAHTAMAGCVGVAGSAVIGRHCTVGGGAIILGHIRIADNVNISAGTLVTKSIPAAGTYTGAYPMDDHKRWMRNASRLRHLDALADRVSAMEKKEKKE